MVAQRVPSAEFMASLGRRGRTWAQYLGAAVGLFAALPASRATACAVCFGADSSQWNGAFAIGTLALGILPPTLIAVLGFAIFRSSTRAQAARAARDAAAALTPASGPGAGAADAPAGRLRLLRPVRDA